MGGARRLKLPVLPGKVLRLASCVSEQASPVGVEGHHWTVPEVTAD
jgi:hypothetical protein